MAALQQHPSQRLGHFFLSHDFPMKDSQSEKKLISISVNRTTWVNGGRLASELIWMTTINFSTWLNGLYSICDLIQVRMKLSFHLVWINHTMIRLTSSQSSVWKQNFLGHIWMGTIKNNCSPNWTFILIWVPAWQIKISCSCRFCEQQWIFTWIHSKFLVIIICCLLLDAWHLTFQLHHVELWTCCEAALMPSSMCECWIQAHFVWRGLRLKSIAERYSTFDVASPYVCTCTQQGV